MILNTHPENRKEMVKAICELTGMNATYGSKVWHSTDAYRRVIWRCNGKYIGEKKCTTPHITQEELEKAFVSVMQRVIREKDTIIATCRELLEGIDTVELDAEVSWLENEASSIAERLRKLVEENARVRKDQMEYQREYNALTSEYDQVNSRVQAMEDRYRNKEKCRRKLEIFLAFWKKWRCAKHLSPTPLRRWWKRSLSGMTEDWSSSSGTECDMNTN